MIFKDSVGREVKQSDFLACAAAPGKLRIGLVVSVLGLETTDWDYSVREYETVVVPSVQVLRLNRGVYRLYRVTKQENCVIFEVPHEKWFEYEVAWKGRRSASKDSLPVQEVLEMQASS